MVAYTKQPPKPADIMEAKLKALIARTEQKARERYIKSLFKAMNHARWIESQPDSN